MHKQLKCKKTVSSDQINRLVYSFGDSRLPQQH